MEVRKIARYGWRPGLPDHRRKLYSAFHPVTEAAALPTHVDLRPYDSKVYDQQDLGSCTGQSIAGMCEFITRKEGKKDFVPSRLFIYYNERVIEGTVDQDSGAAIADGMKVVHTLGVANEKNWAYDISKFTHKPPAFVFENAKQHIVNNYYSLDNTKVEELKTVLASGYPFVFGFTVYESFESEAVAKTGKVPMPRWHEQILGGHAVMSVGFDDSSKVFIVRNSWGTGWGLGGYFLMPYDYITNANLADDFWVAHTIS